MPRQGDKVATDDRKDASQVPLNTDFHDEEKLSQSGKAEDKAVYAVKKFFASLDPKTQVLADLHKKYADDEKGQSTPEYLADLKKAESELTALRAKELVHLDQLYIAQSQKNYVSSVLCCIGAIFCFSNPATGLPYVAGGSCGFATAKVQDKWAKRSMTTVEHDLATVREEIAKLSNHLKLQTGSRVASSHASTFSVGMSPSLVHQQYQPLAGQDPRATVRRN
jgi:hypothetical protein